MTEDHWATWQASFVRGQSAHCAGKRRAHFEAPDLIGLTSRYVLSSKMFLANMQVPNVKHRLRQVSVRDKKPLMNASGDHLPCFFDVDEKDPLWVARKDNMIMKKKSLKLRWRKFDHLAANVGGADKIFCDIFTRRGTKDTFWLDSASTEKVCIL